jgi:ribosome-binding factor A
MKKNRLERLNSLLKEIISEVIHRSVKNPHINTYITVTKVDTSPDLSHAKIAISLIGTPAEKAAVLIALQSAAGFIAVKSSEQADLRYFPKLSFKLDTGLEEQIRIEELLLQIEQKRIDNPPQLSNDE